MRKDRRAQAIIELAIFGSIFLFVIGSVFQQGFAAISYQQTQMRAMREALLLSYNNSMNNSNIGGSKYNSAQYLIVEDRLSGGVFKYGAVDRQPVLTGSGGTMSNQLMKPIDWSDISARHANDLSVLEMHVNGQVFRLTQAAAYILRIKVNRNDHNDVSLSQFWASGASPNCWEDGFRIYKSGQYAWPDVLSQDRFRRELIGKCGLAGACDPDVYTVITRNGTGWSTVEDYRFDANRNGNYGDDLFFQPSFLNRSQAIWVWDRKSLSTVAGEIDTKNGQYPSYDVDGDMVEEGIYGINAFYCDPYDVWDIMVFDPNAGDSDPTEPDALTDIRELGGLKQESMIYTSLQDGTVLELRRGQWYNPVTNELDYSVNKKRQFDVISRVYQLNRRMINPQDFLERHGAASGGWLEGCDAANPMKDPEGASCCTNGSTNLLKNCLDLSTRTLYLRSVILDERGRKWINSVDTTAQERLLRP